jgi:hypothetical protein
VLLATHPEGATALYSDVAFTKSGSIVTCVGGIADRRGAYRGIPVSKKHTIYKGTLLEYNVDQMNRYSHEEKCNCPMPIGDIVYSGFDLTNRKFVVVSRNRTLVFDYTVDGDYSINATYNHDVAIGFAEGNVVLRGDGEPGKLTDCFDVDNSGTSRYIADSSSGENGGISISGATDITATTVRFYYRDLTTPPEDVINRYIVQSLNYNTITSGDYSLAYSIVGVAGFKQSDMTYVDLDGVTRVQTLISNSVNGHLISELQFLP